MIFNIFKAIRKLEESTRDRFSCVMTSNMKMNGRITSLQNHNQKMEIRLKHAEKQIAALIRKLENKETVAD